MTDDATFAFMKPHLDRALREGERRGYERGLADGSAPVRTFAADSADEPETERKPLAFYSAGGFTPDDAVKYADYFAEDDTGAYPGDLHRHFGHSSRGFADATKLLRKQVFADGKPGWRWVKRAVANAAGNLLAAEDAQGHEHAKDGKFAKKGQGGEASSDASKESSKYEPDDEGADELLRSWAEGGSKEMSRTSLADITSGKASPAIRTMYDRTQEALSGKKPRDISRAIKTGADKLAALANPDGTDFSSFASWSDDEDASEEFWLYNSGDYEVMLRIEGAPNNTYLATHDTSEVFGEVESSEGFNSESEIVAAPGRVKPTRILVGDDRYPDEYEPEEFLEELKSGRFKRGDRITIEYTPEESEEKSFADDVDEVYPEDFESFADRADGETWQTNGRYYKREGGRTRRLRNPNAAEKDAAKKERSEAYKKANEGRTPKEQLIHKKEQAEPRRQVAREAVAAAIANPQSIGAKEAPALAEHLHSLTRDEVRELARTAREKLGGLKSDLVARMMKNLGVPTDDERRATLEQRIEELGLSKAEANEMRKAAGVPLKEEVKESGVDNTPVPTSSATEPEKEPSGNGGDEVGAPREKIGKEPWQMSQNEFANANKHLPDRIAAREWRQSMQEAAADGKPVDPQFFEDYPSLKPSWMQQDPDILNRLYDYVANQYADTEYQRRRDEAVNLAKSALRGPYSSRAAKEKAAHKALADAEKVNPENLDADRDAINALKAEGVRHHHARDINRAIEAGKPVPLEVIKQYPELAEKYTATARGLPNESPTPEAPTDAKAPDRAPDSPAGTAAPEATGGDAGGRGSPAGDDSQSGAEVKPGSVAALDDESFAKKVQQVADDHTHGFGGYKVYIADVYNALKAEDPSLTREQFNEKLLEANRQRHLTLSRADLVQLMDPDAVKASEIKHPLGNADYHFITAKQKPRQERKPTAEQVVAGAERQNALWAKSGKDRINQLSTAGKVEPGMIADSLRNYARNDAMLDTPTGKEVDRLAREHIAKLSPEQQKELAELHRADVKHTKEVAPALKDLLAKFEPAAHKQARDGAIARLGKVPGLTDEQRDEFRKRIEAVQGDSDMAVADAAYGITDEAVKAGKAAQAKPPEAAPAQQPAPAPAATPATQPVSISGHDAARNRVKSPDTVTAVPKTKKAKEDLTRDLKAAWNEARNALAVKHGTRYINDLLTPEQVKAEGDLLEALGVVASGHEYNGPHDLGPVSDGRYQGYYRRAVSMIDQLRNGATGEPAAKAEPAPKVPKAAKVSDTAGLKKKPLADKESLNAIAAAATSQDAKDYLETAAWNVPGDKTSLSPEDRRHQTVERLAAAHRDAVKDGKGDAAAEVAKVLEQFGGKLDGVPNTTVPFDPAKYDAPAGSSPDAPMQVVRPPVVGPDGRLAIKGELAPRTPRHQGRADDAKPTAAEIDAASKPHAPAKKTDSGVDSVGTGSNNTLTPPEVGGNSGGNGTVNKAPIAPVSTKDYQSVKPVDLSTGSVGAAVTDDSHQIPHGGAAVLRTSPFKEPVVRVPYSAADGSAGQRDIPEGTFNKLRKDIAAAGLDPAEHLPAALAAGHGTDKKAADRVAEYLASQGGKQAPVSVPATPASNVGEESPKPAPLKTKEEAQKAYGDQMAVVKRAGDRLAAAKAKLPTQPSAFDLEMGAKAVPVPPEVRAEVDAAEAERKAADTELDRLQRQIYQLPSASGAVAKPKSTKASPARELSQKELLKLSNTDLAERGLVRTRGPQGEYVRRGTAEELNDHI